jgi:hypothetical protein
MDSKNINTITNSSSENLRANNLQTYLLQNAVNTTINNLNDEDNENKIVSEFAHLQEKSKQLFNGLR